MLIRIALSTILFAGKAKTMDDPNCLLLSTPKMVLFDHENGLLGSSAKAVILIKSTYIKPHTENKIPPQYDTYDRYAMRGYVIKQKTVINNVFPLSHILDDK